MIDLVVGARPNFMKAFPLLREIKNFTSSVRLINTGQHFDHNMSEIFFEQLQTPKPDINLEVGSGTHAEQTAKILSRIELTFIQNRPNLVIVFGDVNSTVAAALAASKLHIPIAHVESGLRSFDRTMQEEINRVITDQISDLLFTTSPEAEKNLINEGRNKNNIFFVGNTMIDSIVQHQNKIIYNHILDKLNILKKNYILVTLHRPSNVDNQKSLSRIYNSINLLSTQIPVIWIVHPRVRKNLNIINKNSSKSLHFIEPLGYFEFLGLQSQAKIILTDSGGVQEESSFFGVPCLTLRDNTERPITIDKGTNKLIGTDYNNISDEVQKIIANNNNNNNSKINKWDGRASGRICSVLAKKNFFL